MRITWIRAKDCCGSAYGVGFVMSHWDHAACRHCALRIHLWWCHVIVVFRKDTTETRRAR